MQHVDYNPEAAPPLAVSKDIKSMYDGKQQRFPSQLWKEYSNYVLKIDEEWIRNMSGGIKI